MTSPRVVRFAQLESKLWRNGLGVTRTIRPMSDGGGWALSIATLERPAEFSIMPRAQRVQLAIESVRLVIDGVETILGPREQVRFSGDQQVTGSASASSARVLNVIAREAFPLFEVAVVRHPDEVGEGVVAVVVLDGSLRLGGDELGLLDTVLLEGVGQVQRFGGVGVFAVVRRLT